MPVITYVKRFTGRCGADGKADLPLDGISHMTGTHARSLPFQLLPQARELGCHLDENYIDYS